MRRRALLASLTGGLVGLAGCQGFGGGEDTPVDRETYGVPPPTRTETATRTQTETATRTSAETTVDRPAVTQFEKAFPPAGLTRTVTTVGDRRRLVVADGGETEVDGELRLIAGFRSGATEAGPARLWVGAANDGEVPERLEFGRFPPLGGFWGRSLTGEGDPPMYAVPADRRRFPDGESDPKELRDGAWVASEADVEAFAARPPAGEVTIPPGQALVGEYALLWPAQRSALPAREQVVFAAPDDPVSLQVGAWDPDAVSLPESSFDRSVPGLPGYDTTVWTHGDTPSPVFLVPERERLELPSDRTTVRMVNYGYRTLGPRGGAWGLFKLHDGTWRRIYPWRSRSRIQSVAPAGTDVLRLTVSGSAVQSDDDAALNGVVPWLGGGTYAVRLWAVPPVDLRPTGHVEVGAGVPEGTGRNRSITFGALLELVGDPVEIRESRHVTGVEYDGDTAVVELQVGEESDYSGTPGTLVVERADPGPDWRELITEQVMQFPALRDALVKFGDGIRRVEVNAQIRYVAAPLSRLGDGTRLRFRYDGQGYVATPRYE